MCWSTIGCAMSSMRVNVSVRVSVSVSVCESRSGGWGGTDNPPGEKSCSSCKRWLSSSAPSSLSSSCTKHITLTDQSTNAAIRALTGEIRTTGATYIRTHIRTHTYIRSTPNAPNHMHKYILLNACMHTMDDTILCDNAMLKEQRLITASGIILECIIALICNVALIIRSAVNYRPKFNDSTVSVSPSSRVPQKQETH